MDSKTLWQSKTLWVNLLAVIGMVIQTNTGFIVSPETQLVLLSIINTGLRLITKQPIDWSLPTGPKEPLCLLVGLALAASLSACATTNGGKESPQVTAGKSLLAVKSTIIATAETTDVLCAAGQLNTATCDQARSVYGQSKIAYDAAVDSYLLMIQGGTGPEAFASSLQAAQTLALTFAQIAGGAK